jgi:hypothetical protein
MELYSWRCNHFVFFGIPTVQEQIGKKQAYRVPLPSTDTPIEN